MRRNMKGFTLMEVVIAFVIVAILAAGTLPALSNLNKQSFQTEIDLNLPSVGQAALNGQSSATSLYADLTDTTTRSVSLLTNELVKHSATVSSKGYTYALTRSMRTWEWDWEAWVLVHHLKKPGLPPTRTRVLCR